MTLSFVSEQRILLQNVSWQLLEHLVAELGEQRSTRITYYKGQLEIMTPRWKHEVFHRLLDRCIQTILEELELDLWLGGATMLQRPHMSVAKEPDSCYYIQNEKSIRGKTDLDLTKDPPPDLVLDVDISNSSYLNQLILYADLDIPEVWRYGQSKLRFYKLNHGAYVECDKSPIFDFLSPQNVQEYLENCANKGINSATHDLRKWVNTVL
jgi:Uma2 family endonuclease